jgi:histone-lysine N-methyltransferase SETMAR
VETSQVITPWRQNVQAWSGNIPGSSWKKGTTLNAVSYCATLERFQAAIKRHPGLLTTGVLLLNNNTRPHIATAIQQLLQRFRWTVLEHLPYSPDLAPSDLHLFPALKDHLSGHKFSSDNDVKTAVTKWLKSQGTEFYEAGINKLVPRQDKCLSLGGDYVEK